RRSGRQPPDRVDGYHSSAHAAVRDTEAGDAPRPDGGAGRSDQTGRPGSAGGEPLNHPLLYQVNTRVFLQERGPAPNRPATLDDVPDAFLDDVAGRGFTWVWWLGVWQTGELGRQISRADVKLRAELQRVLPDLREQDITGSPFAVIAYRVHDDF